MVSKVSKLRDLPTMQLLNSATWYLCYSFTGEKPTEEIPTLSFTCSIRMFFLLCHSSGLVLLPLSLDKPFMNHGCTKVTTSSIRLSLSCGLPFTTSSTKEKDFFQTPHFTL